jgi:hypothetical protein
MTFGQFKKRLIDAETFRHNGNYERCSPRLRPAREPRRESVFLRAVLFCPDCMAYLQIVWFREASALDCAASCPWSSYPREKLT